jgi:hypothetical protein
VAVGGAHYGDRLTVYKRNPKQLGYQNQAASGAAGAKTVLPKCLAWAMVHERGQVYTRSDFTVQI